MPNTFKSPEELLSNPIPYYLIFKICCSISRWHDKEERKYLTLKLVLKIICLYELPPLHFSKVEVGLEWCWLNQVGNKNTASTEGNSSRIVREQHEKQHYICNLCFALHVVR